MQLSTVLEVGGSGCMLSTARTTLVQFPVSLRMFRPCRTASRPVFNYQTCHSSLGGAAPSTPLPDCSTSDHQLHHPSAHSPRSASHFDDQATPSSLPSSSQPAASSVHTSPTLSEPASSGATGPSRSSRLGNGNNGKAGRSRRRASSSKFRENDDSAVYDRIVPAISSAMHTQPTGPPPRKSRLTSQSHAATATSPPSPSSPPPPSSLSSSLSPSSPSTTSQAMELIRPHAAPSSRALLQASPTAALQSEPGNLFNQLVPLERLLETPLRDTVSKLMTLVKYSQMVRNEQELAAYLEGMLEYKDLTPGAGMPIDAKALTWLSWSVGKLSRICRSKDMVVALSRVQDAIADKFLEDSTRSPQASALLELSPGHVCMLMAGFAWLDRCSSPAFLDLVATLAESKIREFDRMGCSNLLWAFARVGYNPLEGRLIQGFVCWFEESHSVLEKFRPRDIANLMWSLATLKADIKEDLLERIAGVALQQLPLFNAHDISNLVWAFAKFSHNPLDGALLEAVATRLNTNHSALDAFTIQGMANFMSAMGALQFQLPKELMDRVALAATRKLDDFVPQDYASILCAFASTAYNPLQGQLVDDILHRLSGTHAHMVVQFSAVDVELFLDACSKFQRPLPPPFLDAMTRQVQAHLPTLSPSAALHLLRAFARTLSYDMPPHLATSLHRIARQYIQGNAASRPSAQDLVSFIWVHAAFRLPLSCGDMDFIATRILQDQDKLPLDGLTKAAWAFAKQDYSPLRGELLDGIVDRVRSGDVLSTADSKSLCNLVWACATVGHELALEFMDDIAGQVLRQQEGVTPQTLSNITWAFARLGHNPLNGGFCDDLIHLVMTRQGKLDDWKPQEIANFVGALAGLDHHVPRSFLDLTSQAMLALLDKLNAIDYSNLLSAYMRLEYHTAIDGALLQRMLLHVHSKGATTTAQRDMMIILSSITGMRRIPLPPGFLDSLVTLSLSSLDTLELYTFECFMWALGRHRHRPTQADFVPKVSSYITQHMESISYKDSSALLWCIAILQLDVDEQLLRGIIARHWEDLNEQDCTLQSVSINVWALAILALGHAGLGPTLHECFLRLLALVGTRSDDGLELANDSMGQLAHVDLVCTRILGLGPETGPSEAQQDHRSFLPEPLRTEAYEYWQSQVHQTQPSLLQMEVNSTLQKMGCQTKVEAISANGMYAIDILIEPQEGVALPVAVEVDGPVHYTTNLPYRPTGDTQLRNRLLEADGYVVVCVPFFEWKAEVQHVYLKNRLSEALQRHADEQQGHEDKQQGR